MQRPRLIDFRTSRFPKELGICNGDIVSCAEYLNSAIPRLLNAREVGETGWWGTWVKTVFNVAQTDSQITLPRGLCRLINVDVCKHPVAVQNEFYEFIEFGIGEQTRANNCNSCDCNVIQTFDRGVKPTFTDLTPPNKIIRVFPSNVADADKRILVQGKNSNAVTIRTLDGGVYVEGVFLDLIGPFQDTPLQVDEITGFQKDITAGPVSIYEVDATTGAQVLLLVMEPGEQVAAYRRYFLSHLPKDCCNGNAVTPGIVQVQAMAKVEFIPVSVDTDYLSLPNLEAVGEECKAVRYESMDDANAKQQAALHHRNAIRLLQGQLVNYLGTQKPAIQFAPFGSARLRNYGLEMI